MPRANRIIDHRVVKGADLIPNPENWRVHPDDQRDVMAALLDRVGYVSEAIAVETPNGLMLIDGHLRAEIGQDDQIPVAVVDLSPEEQRLTLATFDPVAQMAAKATEEYAAVADPDEDSAVGRLMAAVMADDHQLVLGAEEPVEETYDTEAALEEAEAEDYVATTKRGQVWTLGRHRLMCGDATVEQDAKRVLDGQKPKLMVTDPPYGVDYRAVWREKLSHADGRRSGRVTNDDRADWSDAWALAPSDVVYCWCAPGALQIPSGLALEAVGFEIRASIIWRKPHFPISRGHYTFQHEPCWYAVRKGKEAAWIGPANASSVWDVRLDQNVEGGLSAIKPIECMEIPIRNHEGDVYDPFLGSGTTLIAAERQGRRCYAMEIEPRYVDVSIRRWEDYTGQKAKLTGGPGSRGRRGRRAKSKAKR